MVILGHLLWSTPSLDPREKRVKQLSSRVVDVGLCKAMYCVSQGRPQRIQTTHSSRLFCLMQRILSIVMAAYV